jgi:hypothetical protein
MNGCIYGGKKKEAKGLFVAVGFKKRTQSWLER